MAEGAETVKSLKTEMLQMGLEEEEFPAGRFQLKARKTF